MKRRMLMMLLVACFIGVFSLNSAFALTYTFSDKDFLGGSSWGTMDITSYDSDTLMISYLASSATVIPDGSQVTGFAFDFGGTVTEVWNPGDTDFSDDRNDLVWIMANNLNAFPNPANGDEFDPIVTKNSYNFGVTEGAANNFTPPGILPGEKDIFYVDFSSATGELESFVSLTGIRLQSLPDDINEGSLALAGKTPGSAVPEPATVVLLGFGLIGLAAVGRRQMKK